jgi:serine protease
MARSRVRIGVLTVMLAGAAALAVHGQDPSVTGFTAIIGLGLPPVDTGALVGEHPAVRSALPAPTGVMRTALAIGGRMSPAGVRYAKGRVLVKFKAGVNSTIQAQSLRAASSTAVLARRPEYADFDEVTIADDEDAETVAAAFRARPDVEYAQPAYFMHPTMVPNDTFYKELQWNFPLIDIERAWDIQPQAGSSITVAVIDSGLAFTNATITANILGFTDDRGVRYPPIPNATIPYAAANQIVTAGRIVNPRNFVNNNDQPFDFIGHGTHVAATIGQLTNDGVGAAGIAFNVKLMPLKAICGDWDILFGTPPSRCGTDDQVAQAIRFAADNGARVINMSIGRDSPSTCATNRNQPGCAPVIEDALNYAVGRGAFISISAGNEFDAGNPTQLPAEIASRIQGAVSVAAIDLFKNHTFYSSSGTWVELAAPGGGGGSTDQGYVFQQTFNPNATDTFDLPVARYTAPRFDIFATVGYAGTSMASPHVAAVAAMLMQQGITDPAAVEAALERYAIDLGATGKDDFFGFGLIDARKSLFGMGLAK